MTDNKKTISMEIRADGSHARRETQSVARDVAAMKRKAEGDVMAIRGFFGRGGLGGVYDKTFKGLGGLGGVYDKTFKGLGGDISRSLGMDKLFSNTQSGLGKLATVASFAFTGVARVATFAFTSITGGLRLVGRTVMSALTAPLRLATTAFKALGISAAAAAAGVYTGLKALRPAADMQQYQIQLEVLLGDPAKARARLAELSKYAKDTNYSPAEIIESANLMESFGIYGNDISRLKLASDAANAFGKDIREVVQSISYLSSGRSGEAMQSLSRIGVTREKLNPFGVEFSKSGEMTTEPKKAIDAVFQYFASAFGGMTARQSKTWKGAIQQLGGEVYDAFARGFKSALGPLTQFVTGNVIPMIDSIGKRLTSIKWDEILSPALKMLGGMTEIISQITDPQTQSRGLAELKELGSSLWDGAKVLLGGFGDIGAGLLKDLGGILESFISDGGIGKVFSLAWEGLKLAMEGGAGLFKIVLSGFSAEFLSGLKITLGDLLGKDIGDEKAKRADAEWEAQKRVLEAWEKHDPEGYERSRDAQRPRLTNKAEYAKVSAAHLQYVATQKASGKTPMSRAEFFERHYRGSLAEIGVSLNPMLGSVKNKAFRTAMGWDGPNNMGDPMAAFNAQRQKFASALGGMGDLFGNLGNRAADRAVIEKYADDTSSNVQEARQQAFATAQKQAQAESRHVTQKDVNREFVKIMRHSVPEVDKLWKDTQARRGFAHTTIALGALPGVAATGFAPAGQRLASNAQEARLRAKGEEIAAQGRERDEATATRLSTLRQAGWQMVMQDGHGRTARDMSGKQVKFETERHGAAAAAARQEYYAVAARRRQDQVATQTAYRQTVAQRLGLSGERQQQYWRLIDRGQEERRQYSRRHTARIQAGDQVGAAAVRRQWQERSQSYRQEIGNLLQDVIKPSPKNAANSQARAEKSLGDMAVLLSQQKLLQTDLLKAMQGVDETLRIVMGV